MKPGLVLDLLFQSMVFSKVISSTLKHQNYWDEINRAQKRHIEVWWNKYFCPIIGDAADEPLQYVEPINSKRDRKHAKFKPLEQEKFDQLRQEKCISVIVFSMLDYRFMSKASNAGSLLEVLKNLDVFKTRVLAQSCPHTERHCDTYRGLLEIILK